MSPTPKSVLDERVTEEAVRWAYRLVLGRGPENDEIVREHCLKTTSLLHPHEAFVGSAELCKRVAGVMPPQPTGLEPRLAIDKAETPELRQRLLDHIARSWTHLGETEPHWSVLTEDQFLSGTLDANLAAFHVGRHGDPCAAASCGLRHRRSLWHAASRSARRDDSRFDRFALLPDAEAVAA